MTGPVLFNRLIIYLPTSESSTTSLDPSSSLAPEVTTVWTFAFRSTVSPTLYTLASTVLRRTQSILLLLNTLTRAIVYCGSRLPLLDSLHEARRLMIDNTRINCFMCLLLWVEYTCLILTSHYYLNILRLLGNIEFNIINAAPRYTITARTIWRFWIAVSNVVICFNFMG